MHLETERLIIRDWRLEDANVAFTIYGDPEVMRYVGTGQPFASLEQTRETLGRIIERDKDQPMGFWAVDDKTTGQLVGGGLLKYLPRSIRYRGWIPPRSKLVGEGNCFGNCDGIGSIWICIPRLGEDRWGDLSGELCIAASPRESGTDPQGHKPICRHSRRTLCRRKDGLERLNRAPMPKFGWALIPSCPQNVYRVEI